MFYIRCCVGPLLHYYLGFNWNSVAKLYRHLVVEEILVNPSMFQPIVGSPRVDFLFSVILR
jgi:hypothetical protein